ncbi:MAG TPA: hypothetical protein VHX38_11985, partial [Pseudonocardiaceae bacterium]|nr:hypothetical protein [Pseudonocardiaceae bacterium]
TIESTTTDRATNPPNDHPTTPNHHPKTPTQPNPTQQQDPLKLRGIARQGVGSNTARKRKTASAETDAVPKN